VEPVSGDLNGDEGTTEDDSNLTVNLCKNIIAIVDLIKTYL